MTWTPKWIKGSDQRDPESDEVWHAVESTGLDRIKRLASVSPNATSCRLVILGATLSAPDDDTPKCATCAAAHP